MVGTSKLGSCCMAIDIRDAPRVTGTFQDHLKDSPHLCRRPARVLMRKRWNIDDAGILILIHIHIHIHTYIYIYTYAYTYTYIYIL